MKKLLVLIGMMTFFVVFSASINARSSEHSTIKKDSIHVWTSPDMFDIATTWANEYMKNKPEAMVQVSKISNSNVTDITDITGDIGLITKNYLTITNKNSIWKMPIGRDIIVPVMNPKNPLLNEILAKGISPEEFTKAFSSKQNQTWGTLLNTNQSTPINYYSVENEGGKNFLTDFLNIEFNKTNRKDVNGLNELFSKIKADKYSLAFCKLIDLQNFERQETENLISLIPIDLNGNNKIDVFENIYKNSNVLERGVWIGKYPGALFSNIYSIAKNQPTKGSEIAFLEWILTEGQQYLNADGYSELLISERQRKVESLNNNPTPIIEAQKPVNKTTSTIILIVVISALFITPIVLMYFRSKNPVVEEERIISKEVFAETTISIPDGVFFDKSHTWAFMERDGSVKIGVADFLQHTTGTITKIKTKNAGDSVKKGESFLTLIQYGKQLDIQSPISGKIKEINTKLNRDTSIINSSPYTEGWIYSIESNNWMNEIRGLFIGETYRTWLKDEFTRLKDFFSSTIRLDLSNHLQTVIQDGGELNDNPMENYGPEVWEEFQTVFINRS